MGHDVKYTERSMHHANHLIQQLDSVTQSLFHALIIITDEEYDV